MRHGNERKVRPSLGTQRHVTPHYVDSGDNLKRSCERLGSRTSRRTMHAHRLEKAYQINLMNDADKLALQALQQLLFACELSNFMCS